MNLSFHWPFLLRIPFVQSSAMCRAYESLNNFPYLILRRRIHGLAAPLILLKDFLMLEVSGMILIKAFAKPITDTDFFNKLSDPELLD